MIRYFVLKDFTNEDDKFVFINPNNKYVKYDEDLGIFINTKLIYLDYNILLYENKCVEVGEEEFDNAIDKERAKKLLTGDRNE